ncbi:MAG: hypothetical protein ACPHF4_11150, partial [Rubripirellula sp.]
LRRNAARYKYQVPIQRGHLGEAELPNQQSLGNITAAISLGNDQLLRYAGAAKLRERAQAAAKRIKIRITQAGRDECGA